MRDDRLVLVYTMGKVGTGTLVRAIAGTERWHPCLIHYAAPEQVARVQHAARSAGRARNRGAATAARVRSWIASGRRPRIVTAVREPGARAVSAFFEDLVRSARFRDHDGPPDYETLAGWFATAEETVEHRYDDFENGWFDREFRETTGIDVYATPFDRQRGAQVISQDGWDVLCLRIEESTAEWTQELRAFLDTPSLTIARPATTRRDPLYREFVSKFRFSSDALDRLYGSRYARHFYSAEELARFRARWEAPLHGE